MKILRAAVKLAFAMGLLGLGMQSQIAQAIDLPWEDEFASTQPDHITLAVRYVAYADASGKPVISTTETQKIFRSINEVYKSCNLHFRVEEFTIAKPIEYGLQFNPSRMRDLEKIRRSFEQPDRLLVINTGKWNHKGGLGADGANAWTMMPGSSPSGAVIEGTVASYAPLIAHELGHYLNLDHVQDQTNMMNPTIYTSSNVITPSQCENMRRTAMTVRVASVRKITPDTLGEPARNLAGAKPAVGRDRSGKPRK